MKSKDEPLYQRAIREFRRIPGVIGVGCGLRKSGDGRSEVAVLRVIVRKKLPLSALNPTHRLPSFFDGVEIDVCERMPSVPAAESTRVLPLQGGLPLDANRGAEGTIGCFANFGSKKVILTAGHVLTELDRGDFGEGGEVGSPELDSSWCCTTGAVGNILKGRVDEAVDCGIAELATKRPVQQLIPGLGSDRTKQNTDRIVGVAPLRTQQSTGIRAPVMVGEHVRKVGATTHRTGGKIAAIDFPIPASPGDDLVAMEHQIIIFPWPGEGRRLADGKEHFCDIGDSGALIMDDDNRAAALLVRKVDLTGQPVPADTGFGGGATNIHRVIEAMQIEIFPSSGVQGTQPTRALSPGHGIFRRPTLTPEQSLRRAFVDGLKHELGKFELGRRLVEFVENHQREIARLVNHRTRVTVAWHRSHGPAFLATFLRELANLDHDIPRQVQGVTVEDGLAAVHTAVEQSASDELVKDMKSLWPPLAEALPRSRTVRALIDNLRSATFNG